MKPHLYTFEGTQVVITEEVQKYLGSAIGKQTCDGDWIGVDTAGRRERFSWKLYH